MKTEQEMFDFFPDQSNQGQHNLPFHALVQEAELSVRATHVLLENVKTIEEFLLLSKLCNTLF